MVPKKRMHSENAFRTPSATSVGSSTTESGNNSNSSRSQNSSPSSAMSPIEPTHDTMWQSAKQIPHQRKETSLEKDDEDSIPITAGEGTLASHCSFGDQSEETFTRGTIAANEGVSESTVRTARAKYLHVHFFLEASNKATGNTDSASTQIVPFVDASPEVKEIAKDAAKFFPNGTRFLFRRNVRFNRNVPEKEIPLYSTGTDRPPVQHRITVCTEYRRVVYEAITFMSPCNQLPFGMAFLFDPTINAQVTCYNCMCGTPTGNMETSATFTALFQGMEVSSVKELVSAFFRAYLEKTAEQIEAHHPFPLMFPSELRALGWRGDGASPPETGRTLPAGFLPARAVLAAAENHKLVDDPVQNVLVLDPVRGVMLLGRALDKRILSPPGRPARRLPTTPPSRKRTAPAGAWPPSRLAVGRMMPPFTLCHAAGARVEVVAMVVPPPPAPPDFRVRRRPDPTADAGAERHKKKRLEEGTGVVSLTEAHCFLTGAGLPLEGEAQGRRGGRDAVSIMEALNAFRVHDSTGPTLGWLLQHSTAFSFS